MFRGYLTITVLMLLLLATIFTPVQAQNAATVTDNGAPHSACTRFTDFSTVLSASVANPPVSNAETTISGPTYYWNETTSGFNLTWSPTSSSATLDSNTITASSYLERGWNSIPVSCTVTYTSTDNTTGQQTPVPYSGVCTVTFFVRVPALTVGTGPNQHYIYGTPAACTGHVDTYQLEIQDNQPTPEPYGFGLPHEEFSGVNPSTIKPNNGYPSTWGPLNYPTGTGTPTADFEDNTAWSIDTAPEASNTFIYNMTQTFYCMELTPPFSAPNSSLYVPVPNGYQDTDPTKPIVTPTLSGFSSNVAASATTAHSITMELGETVRTYPGHLPY